LALGIAQHFPKFAVSVKNQPNGVAFAMALEAQKT